MDIVVALVNKKLQAVQERESATNQSLMQAHPPLQVPRPLILVELSHDHPIIKCCDKVKLQKTCTTVSTQSHCTVAKYSKEFYSCLFSMCQGLIDLPYRHRPYIPSPTPSNHKVKTAHWCVSNNFTQAPVKAKTDGKTASHMAVRQSPYYHNCKLLSPDGSLLAIVDRKKLDWYSQRDLGGKIY